jgi:hypothetical protein
MGSGPSGNVRVNVPEVQYPVQASHRQNSHHPRLRVIDHQPNAALSGSAMGRNQNAEARYVQTADGGCVDTQLSVVNRVEGNLECVADIA